MSETDRGAYTPPTDAPLAFDARQPVRGSRPVPMTLIISALVLVVLVIAIVVFYRSGVRKEGEAPKTVGAPVAEMKTAPPADAQPQDPASGLQIYQSGESGAQAPAQPNFAPPPEQPAPRPAPAAALPPPAAAPTAPVTAQKTLPPAAPASSAPPLRATMPAAPTAPKAPAPAPKAAAAAPPPKAASIPAAAGGAAGVQIGAFSSNALAEAGLGDAAKIAPGAMAGKGKTIEPIQKNGSTLYRTTVTGFASRADAVAFCNQLKAAGKSCFVK